MIVNQQSVSLALLRKETLPPLFNFELGEEGIESFKINGLEALPMVVMLDEEAKEGGSGKNWWLIGALLVDGIALREITDDDDDADPGGDFSSGG